MPDTQYTLSAHTGVICILGHPVRHSLSPRIHNAAFAEQNVDLVYVAFDVSAERLATALAGVRALGVCGANLTLPHKEAAVPLMDALDPAAERVGAVNTVVNDGGRLTGFNTDVTGFAASVRGVLPEGARGRRCLVLGAGGAARAVVAALGAEGAGSVSISNRTQERALALCAVARSWGLSDCEVVAWGERSEVSAGVELIVNATSLGLTDAVKESAVDVDTLHSGQVVVDLVYGPLPTALVLAARAKGAVAIDGREMLVMQAADSYRLWTGQEPPIDVMRRAIGRSEG